MKRPKRVSDTNDKLQRYIKLSAFFHSMPEGLKKTT